MRLLLRPLLNNNIKSLHNVASSSYSTLSLLGNDKQRSTSTTKSQITTNYNNNSCCNLHTTKMSCDSTPTPSKIARPESDSVTSTDEADRLIELAKRNAARYCVTQHVKSGYKIGVGTGSTAAYVIECLSEQFKSGQLTDILCVPTSMQSRYLLIDAQLPMTDLDQEPVLDVCIDGCDECDTNMDCIKGGGGALAQEKIVMSCSKRFMVVADYRKRQSHLGARFTYVPLEVLPLAYLPLKRRIEHTEGGECVVRAAVRKAGPVVSDNGNYVMDWHFDRSVIRSKADWFALNDRLLRMPGLLETGLFLSCVDKAYFGMPDGSVCELDSALPFRRQDSMSHGDGPDSVTVNGVSCGTSDGDDCVECRSWGGRTVVPAETAHKS